MKTCQRYERKDKFLHIMDDQIKNEQLVEDDETPHNGDVTSKLNQYIEDGLMTKEEANELIISIVLGVSHLEEDEE